MSVKHNINLTDLTVDGTKLYCEGRIILESPTAICEIARLDEIIFIIVHPQNEVRDIDYAGTNLWALNMDGKILWKAANLNENTPTSRNGIVFHYSYLRFYDQSTPKITCQVDDRWHPSLNTKTGANIEIYKDINWKNYAEAWPKAMLIQKEIEAEIFLHAEKLCPNLNEDMPKIQEDGPELH